MSIVTETFLMCDKCGQTFGVDDRSQTATTHRERARADGWKAGNRGDVCPVCQGKREREVSDNPRDQHR